MLKASKEDLKLTAGIANMQVKNKYPPHSIQGISGRKGSVFGSRGIREGNLKGNCFGSNSESFKLALEFPKKSFSADRRLYNIHKKR